MISNLLKKFTGPCAKQGREKVLEIYQRDPERFNKTISLCKEMLLDYGIDGFASTNRDNLHDMTYVRVILEDVQEKKYGPKTYIGKTHLATALVDLGYEAVFSQTGGDYFNSNITAKRFAKKLVKKSGLTNFII